MYQFFLEISAGACFRDLGRCDDVEDGAVYSGTVDVILRQLLRESDPANAVQAGPIRSTSWSSSPRANPSVAIHDSYELTTIHGITYRPMNALRILELAAVEDIASENSEWCESLIQERIGYGI